MQLTKWKSIFNEAMTVDGYESPEPGDLPKSKAKQLAKTYAGVRKSGEKDKAKAAKIAWAAVKKEETEGEECQK